MTISTNIVRGIRAIGDAISNTSFAFFNKGRRYVQGREKVIIRLSCGCMFGASAAMAMLYPESSEFRGLYHCAAFVYSVSAIIFSGLNYAEIARHSPYTLAGAFVLIVVMVLSPHLTLESLVPLMPFSIAMGLLVTVYVIPKARMAFQEWTRLFFEQNTVTSDGSRSLRSDAGTVDPNSIRSTGFRGNLEPHSFSGRPDPLELAFMDRHYQMPAHLEIHNIDVELGLGLDDTASASSGGSRDPLL